MELLPIKIASKRVHRNGINFLSIEITSNKAHRNDVEFSHIEITSSSKRCGNSSIFSFRRFNVILTSNQHRFDVLCPLRALQFIAPPVVIRLKLFQLQRLKNPVKPSLKSFERTTINQPLTCSTGQA